MASISSMRASPRAPNSALGPMLSDPDGRTARAPSLPKISRRVPLALRGTVAMWTAASAPFTSCPATMMLSGDVTGTRSPLPSSRHSGTFVASRAETVANSPAM